MQREPSLCRLHFENIFLDPKWFLCIDLRTLRWLGLDSQLLGWEDCRSNWHSQGLGVLQLHRFHRNCRLSCNLDRWTLMIVDDSSLSKTSICCTRGWDAQCCPTACANLSPIQWDSHSNSNDLNGATSLSWRRFEADFHSGSALQHLESTSLHCRWSKCRCYLNSRLWLPANNILEVTLGSLHCHESIRAAKFVECSEHAWSWSPNCSSSVSRNQTWWCSVAQFQASAKILSKWMVSIQSSVWMEECWKSRLGW